MKQMSKVIMGLFVTIFLSGCIAESYDYDPPSLSFNNCISVPCELEKANIDWGKEKNKTADIVSLAKKQKQIQISNDPISMAFSHGDFKILELTVSIWQDDKKINLEIANDRTFQFPGIGEYVVEVNLRTSSGTAQYVGNVSVQ